MRLSDETRDEIIAIADRLGCFVQLRPIVEMKTWYFQVLSVHGEICEIVDTPEEALQLMREQTKFWLPEVPVAPVSMRVWFGSGEEGERMAELSLAGMPGWSHRAYSMNYRN